MHNSVILSICIGEDDRIYLGYKDGVIGVLYCLYTLEIGERGT